MSEEADGLILFFVTWSALIVSGWVVVACGRRSYLRPKYKISSFVFLVYFKDGDAG